MNFMTACVAGLITGILTGFGIGGGTLLMVYMTAFAGIAQQTAQGINLLYFIPSSCLSLISHEKNKFIDKEAAVPAIISGVATAAGAAFLATMTDVSVLKKLFGVFLLIIGVTELFRKD